MDDLVDSANTTALAAWDALTSTAPLINDINSLSFNNQMELEALNSSIDNLQLQLERALQAAASVSVHNIVYILVGLYMSRSVD